MTGQQSQEVPKAAGQQAAVATVTRRARVLLGWLTEEEARLFQNGRRLDLPAAPEHEARARLARNVVSKRPVWALDVRRREGGKHNPWR